MSARFKRLPSADANLDFIKRPLLDRKYSVQGFLGERRRAHLLCMNAANRAMQYAAEERGRARLYVE
jgi:hypothetical protein